MHGASRFETYKTPAAPAKDATGGKLYLYDAPRQNFPMIQ